MGKGKPRSDPNNPQNHYGAWCQYAEELRDGTLTCEGGFGDAKKCKGNRYNCIKTKWHRLAIRKNKGME